jgi:hypothetical protein
MAEASTGKQHQIVFDFTLTIPADGMQFHITGESVDVVKLDKAAVLRHRHVKTLAKINLLMRDIIGAYSPTNLVKDWNGE